MVEKTKEDAPTPEEIKKEEEEEEELSKESKEEEVRSQIIEKHGLDEEADADLINSLVKDKLGDRKSFGKLVKQKRGWREKALKKAEPEEKPDEDQPPEEEENKPITMKDLEERDFKNELTSLEISDELKQEVESYAKLHKCSPKEALKSPYIQFRKEEEEKKAKVEEAATGETRRTHTETALEGVDFSDMNDEKISEIAKNIDRTTEEGQKQWNQVKEEIKKRGL